MIGEQELNDRLKAFDEIQGDTRFQEMEPEIAAFNQKFTREVVQGLSKEGYALGTDAENEDNFCWWVEYGTGQVAAIGGFAGKHRLYYSRNRGEYRYPAKYKNEDECFQDIKSNLLKLYDLVREDSIGEFDNIDLPHNQAVKIAYLLNHENFLPILDKKHLTKICEALGIDPSGMNSLEKNRKILEALNENEVATGWHTVKKAHFWYSKQGIKLKEEKNDGNVLEGFSGEESAGPILYKKKQIILYGPPGTGKTHITKDIAVSILAEKEL